MGSVARAFVAITLAKITGPQFPWGTILINVVGSFAIAFFSTLTISDGRFPASATARAFFMVGVCGGFTTFSSFSLQTLDLARDGRLGQAAGNIALSLAACLLAVSFGWYSAQAINTRGARASAGMEPNKSVVVALLNRPDTAPGLLAAARQWLALSGGGQMKALVINTPAVLPLLPSEEVMTHDREVTMQSEREAWGPRLQTILQNWDHSPQARNVAFSWFNVEGEPEAIVAEHGSRAGVVVTAPRDHQSGERERQALHAALFDCKTPVLVVPPGGARPFGRVVAIAWKDDERAARAVVAAAAVLRQAAQVHVIHALRGGSAALARPALFDQLGIAVTMKLFPAQAGAVGEQLLAAAHEVGADMLVMGAFTHGEWREALLGGVTQYMLNHADLPVLMQH